MAVIAAVVALAVAPAAPASPAATAIGHRTAADVPVPHPVEVGDPTVYEPAPPPPQGTARTLLTGSEAFHVDWQGYVTEAQKAAFQAAVDEWASHISTPVLIRITAEFTDLGPGILGGAGPQGWFAVPNGDPGVVYPQALANSMSGYDVSPSTSDIVAEFDDDAGGVGGWYTGTGVPPAGTYDLMTTVLHELGHGLGFYSTADSNAGANCITCVGWFGQNPFVGNSTPAPFDTHLTLGQPGPSMLANPGGTQWTSALAPNGSTTLLNLFRSNNIYFAGMFTNSNGGPARIFAPASWVNGSSVSHLDDATYPAGTAEALMTHQLQARETARSPGPMTLGMLADIGWHVPAVVDAPNAAFLRNAYHDFLGRLPTTSESLDGEDRLGRHALTRARLVGSLSRSSEWVSKTVSGLYVDIFGRPPDPGGLAYWTGLVSAQRLTVAQVASELYSSAEGFARLAGNDLTLWVTKLYDRLLHRVPDPGGLTYWVGLARQVGRAPVAYSLYQSVESRGLRVDALYRKLLDRDPDPAGRSYWTGRLIDGNDVALAANLAASDEYFLKSPSP